MQRISEWEILSWVSNIRTFENEGKMKMPSFLKPFHFSTLAANVKSREKKLTLVHGGLDYAIRMGLFESIGQAPPNEVHKKQANGRFVEARAVTDDRDIPKLSIEISDMFGDCANEETKNSLYALLAEMLGNCCAHSTNEVMEPFGLVCGQSWRKGGIAQLCLSDTGIGIRNSLAQNEDLARRLGTENACALAAEYGITGKPKGNHSGYGLALADGLIKHNNGTLAIVSGNELYFNQCGIVSNKTMKDSWDGTIIIFEWNINSPLDSSAVYDSWPSPEGMNEGEYDELFF
jgi:hypothetical protein